MSLSYNILKAFYPNPFMQLDALTTVMKVKALQCIMRGMSTCGTEIYQPYKQSVIGHYYRAELRLMQIRNQNICVGVNICMCVNICVWGSGKQSSLEHNWAIRRTLRRKGSSSLGFASLQRGLSGRGWFKADLFLSVEEIWGDKPRQVKFSFYEYLPNVPSGW